MAEAYITTLGKDLEMGKKVSVVGKVDGAHDNGVYMTDEETRMKILYVPTTLSGIIEVRGFVSGDFEIFGESYNEFEDPIYDFAAHTKIIELYKEFPVLRF